MSRMYCSDCAFADFRYNNAPVGSGHSTFLCAKHNKFRNYGNVDCGEWKDRHKEARMKCDKLKLYSQCYDGNDGLFYHHTEVEEAIAELKQKLDKAIAERDGNQVCIDALKAEIKRKECVGQRWFERCMEERTENRRLRRALWLMTAEWSEGMGLASCNIAIKLSFKERFFYHDEANREKNIKKYRHRQVAFFKYADYCRKKAEEYK